MMKLIVDGLNNIAKPCARLLKYGMIFCIVFLSATTAVFINNSGAAPYSMSTDLLCKTAAVTIFYVFAEITAGALIMDCYDKKHR